MNPNPNPIRLGYPKQFETFKSKPFSEELRQKLQDYIAANNFTQVEVARQIGTSEAALSKYLKGEPVGNVEKFEAKAEDALKAAEKRKNLSIELMETSVAKSIAGAIETIRKTNDFGLISGPAGLGKSCGINLYARANPTAVVITAWTDCCNGPSLDRALFEEVEPRKWNWRNKRSLFLVERFRDSGRPLIVDNAHRLRKSGLDYLFDFYDLTNIPICLVGNPEVVERIGRNDQHFSRLGLHRELKSLKGSEEVARFVIQQVAPMFLSCLPLAVTVIESRGHIRALRKLLNLAHELTTHPRFRDEGPAADLPERAFRAAHNKLIRDYKLP